MLRPHYICKFLLQSAIVLQLLFWNVEANFENNETLIKKINDMDTTWTAGENKMVVPGRFTTRRPKKRAARNERTKPIKTPDTFDARDHWKDCCNIIKKVRQQGRCDSSWAVAASSVLSDRICIASNASTRVHLSSEDIMTCCNFCVKKSCSSGSPDDAIYFWMKDGVVSGREYKSDRGCKPYSKNSFDGNDQDCKKTCTNKKHSSEYDEDKHRGKMVYRLRRDEEFIRTEIYTHGPVVATMKIHEDFLQYKKGVYQHVLGKEKGRSSVKILGWGEEGSPKKTKYWLILNTIGDGWGMDGFAKIKRGDNECEIEQRVVAGRMFDSNVPAPIPPGEERARQASTNNGHIQRSVFFVKSLIFMFPVWILKWTL